jgi:hypothetical protein
MRVKLTQTTTKYFIITAVSAFSGGNTTITVYGGTDYTLANAAISGPYYSVVKAPYGFPLDPSKWTVEVTDTASRSQSSPVSGTWYNLNSNQISVPIGCWALSFEAAVEHVRTSSTQAEVRCCLSTSNSSASDALLLTYSFTQHGSATADHASTVTRERVVTLAAKTTYYLNLMQATGSNTTTLLLRGDLATTVIRAVCAYL